VVRSPFFDRGNDRPLATPLDETVIYETHVKGFTSCHTDLPAALRGTYAGLGHPVAIDHLTKLGITAVEHQANGEDNHDGESYNRSWNCGVEGPTDDPGVLDCRRRQQRNFLTTLLLSQGVPMLLGGDELGRTQRGNNNAYGQDNELSWYDWDNMDRALLDFTRQLITLRREHPVFRRRRWFRGQPIRGGVDISWLRPDGWPMDDADWDASLARSLGGVARRPRAH
jgi:pullulanase/glycogen debranching enzyme